MKIGNKKYDQIIITDKESNLLAMITDEDIIEENDCKVLFEPREDKSNTLKLIELITNGISVVLSVVLLIKTMKKRN